MSGSCTGYRGTSGGTCSGSSATYYSSFTCKSGYTKSGNTCKKNLDLDPIVKPGTGCALCCTSGKPYCYNNQCYSYCPAGGSQMCPMCALRDEEFIPDASCPGGAQYSTCACGGTHTARGYTGAHACPLI